MQYNGRLSFIDSDVAAMTEEGFIRFARGKFFPGNTPEDEELQLKEIYAICCKEAGVAPTHDEAAKPGKATKPAQE